MGKDNSKKGKHFVLVHGICVGAWAWYKLKPLLESSGHRVTALDMAASGVNPKSIHEVTTLSAYTEPLMKFMEALPPDDDEKVILVGHSYGGYNLALAMEHFPEKISVAVFVTAVVPDTVHPPTYVVDQFFGEEFPLSWIDSKFESSSQSNEPLMTIVLGPNYLRARLCQLCSDEDFELMKMLSRPGSLFTEDLTRLEIFSNEGFGSVEKVFVVCGQDRDLTREFQRWMIENAEIKKVMEIKDSDHMAMLCKPRELCDCLVQVAEEHGNLSHQMELNGHARVAQIKRPPPP